MINFKLFIRCAARYIELKKLFNFTYFMIKYLYNCKIKLPVLLLDDHLMIYLDDHQGRK